jgi:eukaryotic-like serine/threonine-protein kinase
MSGNPQSNARPAENLVGQELKGGWRVVMPMEKSADQTGGMFSVGYVVESSSGKRGFLKAIDFSGAMEAEDPARELEKLTISYNFERDLLAMCRDRRMDRVVTAIADGGVMVANEPVQYLIFELADCDVRKHLGDADNVDEVWILRSLHHIATGLWQLHRHRIAHQDLKPSNVLVFGGRSSKIADLGRSSRAGAEPPTDEYVVPGDYGYAPPELLYNHVSPDWTERRVGCDAYLLGSMAVFFFTGVGMTTLLTSKLDAAVQFEYWGGTYGEVLPFVRDAFDEAIDDFSQQVPVAIREDLTAIVRQLCDPDPKLRGDGADRRTHRRLSLERYVTRFDLLAQRAEIASRQR